MSDTNKCPICQRNNNPDKKLCQNCGWYLPLQSGVWQDQTQKLFGVKTLENIEKWAWRVWDRLERYKLKIKELEKELEKHTPIVNSLDPQKITELEQNFKNLSDNLEIKIQEKIGALLLEFEKSIEQQVNLQIQEEIRKIITLEENTKKLEQEIVKLRQQLQTNNQNLDDNLEVKTDKTVILEKSSPQLLSVNSPDNTNKSSQYNQQLNQEEQWVIHYYYQDSNTLLNHAQTVSISEETINDIWKNKVDQIIFEPSLAENEYWLLRVGDSVNIYLVPARDLIINNNFKVVQNIFKLNNFSKSDVEHEYKLIKPAKVINFGGDNWKLTETGILQF